MIKRNLRSKDSFPIEVYHFKLLIESSPYLNDLHTDVFLISLLQGVVNCKLDSQPLNDIDKAMMDIVLDLEESYCTEKEKKKKMNENNSKLEDIDIRNLLPELELSIDHLVDIYLSPQ